MTQKCWRKSFRYILLICSAIPIFIYARSGNPPPGRTGGFGELDCTACHRTNPVNSGSGSVTITGPASFTSGSAYPIRVTVSHPDQQRWGFELSSRTQGGQQAGSLIPGGDGWTQLLPELDAIQYIAHTSAGTRIGTPASGSFDFMWVAPDVSAGPVVFNAAGNAANGSLSNSGDFIYTTETTLPPRTTSGPAPVLPDGSAVNGASFALHPAPVAPGSIVAVFGTNLTDGANAPNTGFGNDGRLLTNLAGARVSVNGVAAPLFYATGGTLGVQIPTELTGTTATIQINVAGQTSATRTINVDSAAPGLFTLNSQGTGQGAVLVTTSGEVAAPSGSVPGRTARPARPGELVTLYGTGLGQVTPAVATGRKPSGLTQTVANTTVTIDGLLAEVQFSGLSECCVGLNQVNVRVPANARVGSSIPVVLFISGKRSNTVTIAIAGP